eukprot:CAMPEP_0196598288 /NCGR_PEP_ID=MMETSP1081-20130531/94234_1 /TAXON_ID=36882 /ORGANISM="Pyramimonas amylifera, Strain CCMP720" /LENGTH=175 /DNA_ID=CAMNT_0041923961 /DNA_START=653 /DNA_END=1180 /DNA_ORIENTATION=+
MATSLNNMATLHRSLGDLTKAHQLYCHSLDIREKVYGHHHPATAESYNNIALVLSELGQLVEAIKMSEQCCMVAKNSYEPDHPELLNFFGNYGIILKANGKLVEARVHLTNAVEGLRNKGIESSHIWIRKFMDHLSDLSIQKPNSSNLGGNIKPDAMMPRNSPPLPPGTPNTCSP